MASKKRKHQEITLQLAAGMSISPKDQQKLIEFAQSLAKHKPVKPPKHQFGMFILPKGVRVRFDLPLIYDTGA